jgi:hypothetical protein
MKKPGQRAGFCAHAPQGVHSNYFEAAADAATAAFLAFLAL